MARALSGISVSLLALAVGTAIAALASDRWGCGGLFTGCQDSKWKAVASGVAGLMIAGSACLTAVLIMDLLTLCNEAIALRPGFGVARIVFLAIGTATLLVAVLVYTAEVGQQWSYFLAVCSSVLTIQLVVMMIIFAICARISVE
ncbi:Neutral sphingomyelinase [Paragonimus westermani]|uniref:Neutral sphingomyelinase n=1 Tax=Paragonimus westermani TaxID=34504 RepID=A0A8T0D673_9TREM|nr:Neutral sphingomyelinase [Paragonimus westermani]